MHIMHWKNLRNWAVNSKYLYLFTFPIRVWILLKFNIINIKKSISWLFNSREFTNFTYELTELNKNQIVGQLSYLTGYTFEKIIKLISEIEENRKFSNEVAILINNSRRNYEVDLPLNFARRIVWYVLIRVYKPSIVVETGTEKGIGSLIILEALKKNKKGKLISIDIDPHAGSYLKNLKTKKLILKEGDSLTILKELKKIDFFIHDSNHSIYHEKKELNLIYSKLTKRAIVISDNSHCSNALYEWCVKNKMKFIFIKEEPANHFYGGGGVGIALK